MAQQSETNYSRPRFSLGDKRSPKRSEVVARELSDQIISANLAPGTQLDPEHEMLEHLGVGRTTLREALRLLETRGVLTIKSGPGGGPVVRRPRPSDLSESLTLILQFQGNTLLDVVEARRWLEMGIAELAASRATPELIAELREINQVLRDDGGEHQETIVDQNAKFHSRISEASGNYVLHVFLETIISMSHGRTIGVTYGKRQVKGIADAHDEIVDALEKGDGEAAGEAMSEHLLAAQVYWKRRYSQIIQQPVEWSQDLG
jgi:DNA-binding FadR family transcriptional regulator